MRTACVPRAVRDATADVFDWSSPITGAALVHFDMARDGATVRVCVGVIPWVLILWVDCI